MVRRDVISIWRHEWLSILVLISAATVVQGSPQGDVCDTGRCDTVPGAARWTSTDQTLSLLQSLAQQHRSRHAADAEGKKPKKAAHKASCTRLTNMVSHFTVEIGVGTPEQHFSVVADTGSDSIIVPSCFCRDVVHNCGRMDRCFNGSKSSTYGAPTSSGYIPLSFGSGNIEASASSDVVHFGGLTQRMQDGVLQMVDQQLDLDGSFEGIMGLGLPNGGAMYPTSTGDRIRVPQYLSSVGVQRFSVCFGDGWSDGVLRIEPKAVERALPQIGQFHWGLGLWGVSVGATTAPVAVCSETDMDLPGQATPCGAIPDSGTTLLMGPVSHLLTLFASMCDAWPRCARLGLKSRRARSDAFHTLLYNCGDWLYSPLGLRELPPLVLHLGGAGGERRRLELSSWAYVTETTVLEFEVVTKKLFGVLPISLPKPEGVQRVCTAAFGQLEYTTAANGPVWILGMPLFYEFQVVFGLTAPLSVGFDPSPCGSCEKDGDTLPPATPAPSQQAGANSTGKKSAAGSSPASSNSSQPRTEKSAGANDTASANDTANTSASAALLGFPHPARRLEISVQKARRPLRRVFGPPRGPSLVSNFPL